MIYMNYNNFNAYMNCYRQFIVGALYMLHSPRPQFKIFPR